MAINWEMLEPGWWVSEIGGICQEAKQQWVFWPKDDRRHPPAGPWKTLKEAKAGALSQTNGER